MRSIYNSKVHHLFEWGGTQY